MTGPDAADWLWPDWRPQPAVRLAVTTRSGDLSPAPWRGFNLGLNTGDDPDRVRRARQQVRDVVGTRQPPAWLRQVHGTRVVMAGPGEPEADGVWTAEAGRPCVVLTADCLPVLIARTDGSAVGAFHAGWRGLSKGILDRAVTTLAPGGEPLVAWLGPAICRHCYQVGDDLYQAFTRSDPDAVAGFYPDPEPGRWRLDLKALATQALRRAQVERITDCGWCTLCNNERFYSHRGEGRTGRFASLIWLAESALT